jgi:hypothetical protein
MGITRVGKDFSHPLEMTNKIADPVISNEVRDLSELNQTSLQKLLGGPT